MGYDGVSIHWSREARGYAENCGRHAYSQIDEARFSAKVVEWLLFILSVSGRENMLVWSASLTVFRGKQ